MSIATEITRIKTAKADIKSAIEEKGVEVGNGTIDTYADKIGEISGGGGLTPYYSFRPTSPTNEFYFPIESLPSEYTLIVFPDKFPLRNPDHFACVSMVFNKMPNGAHYHSGVVLKPEDKLSTGQVGVSYRNNGFIVSDNYATFLPEYTYNVFVITR